MVSRANVQTVVSPRTHSRDRVLLACCGAGMRAHLKATGKVRTGEGKTGAAYSSCCLQIENLQRQVFILPRDKILGADGEETEHDVSMMDHVFPEFSQIARQKGIKKHKCKVTNRSYMYHFQDPR